MDDDGVRSWLEQRVSDHEFSGVAMVWRDGTPMFTFAGGLAHRGHGVPITFDTRFGVASITKMVVAATVLRLAERGLVALDQPLVDVLPPDQRPDALTEAHTVHHVLSHSSGLTNYHDDADQTWTSFTSAWDRVPTYHARDPADMLPLFADLPAQSKPGKAYEYADANFILAGLVIEAVTHRSFRDVAIDEVIVPAGLTDTAFNEIDLEPARLASAYMATDDPPETWRANCFSVAASGMPDGGLITTATDLARLIDGIVGATFLSPESAKAMITQQTPASEAVEQYGYGCELVVVDGRVTIIGHGGADPGVSAMLSHWLDEGVTTVALCNIDRGSWPVTQRLVRELGVHDPRE